MLASGMTMGVSDMSNTAQQDATTTSQASTSPSTVSNTQAAANEASGKAEDTATTKISKPVNPNIGIESKVREYFSDLPIMAEVSKCESRYRQFSADGSILRGVVNGQDVGVMQINEYYHLKRAKKLGMDVRTLEGNLDYARLLYEEEGTRPWKASAPCWMKSDVAKAMYAPKKLAER